MVGIVTPTRFDYIEAFNRERCHTYAIVDAFEAQAGYAVDFYRLIDAARVLACPVKVHLPNWQHGRVIYAALRRYLAEHGGESVQALDVGTAKGFSALCMQWALLDASSDGQVTSVDVIDPAARVSRNTIVELDGLKTLAETLAPWPEATAIRFLQSTGLDYLRASEERIHFAFVDGKHTGSVVYQEGQAIAQRQRSGDVVLFDDVQIQDVSVAVTNLMHFWRLEWLPLRDIRQYAIGVRR